MSLNRMTASDADGTVYVSRVVEAINLAAERVQRPEGAIMIAAFRNAFAEVEPDVRWIITLAGKLDSAGGSSRTR